MSRKSESSNSPNLFAAKLAAAANSFPMSTAGYKKRYPVCAKCGCDIVLGQGSRDTPQGRVHGECREEVKDKESPQSTEAPPG
jgi:hypothetical protein